MKGKSNSWPLLMVAFCLGSNQLISTVFSASLTIPGIQSTYELLRQIIHPFQSAISLKDISNEGHQLLADSHSGNKMNRDRLYVGDKLFVNEILVSDNEKYEARLQVDGKVVIRNRENGAVMLTAGSGNVRAGGTEDQIESLQMTENGQLVLILNNGDANVPLVNYPKEDCTDGGDCVLIMQGDGNLVAYKKYMTNDPIPYFSAFHSQGSWSSSSWEVKQSTTRFPSESTTVAPIISTMKNFPTITISEPNIKRDRLFVGDKLFVNETLVSDNGKFEARLLKDGKVVVSDRDDAYFRLTVHPEIYLNVDETEGETLFLQMLPDGQLVLSINDRRGVIKSQVPFVRVHHKQDCIKSHCFLLMQDDSNLVAYNERETNDPYGYPFFSSMYYFVEWSSYPEAPSSALIYDQPNKRDRLFVGDKLHVNEALVSSKDLFEARLMQDGKVVISPRGGGYIRLTLGSGDLIKAYGREKIEYLQMLRNGQLVVSVSRNGGETQRQVPLLSYHPRENCDDGGDECFLIMQDDGNLVAYRRNLQKSPSDAFFSAWNYKWWTLGEKTATSRPNSQPNSYTPTTPSSIIASKSYNIFDYLSLTLESENSGSEEIKGGN